MGDTTQFALDEPTCALPHDRCRYVEQVTKLTTEGECNPNESTLIGQGAYVTPHLNLQVTNLLILDFNEGP